MSGAQRIYRRNPLAFPGRAPGFNPAHPAARGMNGGNGFSGVALPAGAGSGFINLLNGQIPSSGNFGANAIIAPLGPSVYNSSNNNFNAIGFNGAPVVQKYYGTIAIILQPAGTQTGNPFSFCTSNGASGGWGIAVSQSSGLNFSINVNQGTSFSNYIGGFQNYYGNNLSPMFGLISWTYDPVAGTSVCDCVMTDLATGQIFAEYGNTQTGRSFQTLANSDGQYVVGISGAGGGRSFNGYIAAAMYNQEFLDRGTIAKWARDPWSFWYPTTVENLIFRALATPGGSSSFLAAWALGRNQINGGVAS